MKKGLFYKGFNGHMINGKRYIIELLACDRRSKSCSFMINGDVVTKNIFLSDKEKEGKQVGFDLDGDYMLVINSIRFDYCDNKRICDYDYEAYDLVDIAVKKVKNE